MGLLIDASAHQWFPGPGATIEVKGKLWNQTGQAIEVSSSSMELLLLDEHGKVVKKYSPPDKPDLMRLEPLEEFEFEESFPTENDVINKRFCVRCNLARHISSDWI